jgi:hypothetical protein
MQKPKEAHFPSDDMPLHLPQLTGMSIRCDSKALDEEDTASRKSLVIEDEEGDEVMSVVQTDEKANGANGVSAGPKVSHSFLVRIGVRTMMLVSALLQHINAAATDSKSQTEKKQVNSRTIVRVSVLSQRFFLSLHN